MKRKKLPSNCGIYNELKNDIQGFRARIGSRVSGGKELKKFFQTYEEAESWIFNQVANIKKHGQGTALLSAAQAEDAFKALEALALAGLDVALSLIAQYYLALHAPNRQKPLQAALDEFLADKDRVQCSAAHTTNLSDVGNRFIRWCDARDITQMSGVTYKLMEEYLKHVSTRPDGKPLAAKTIHGYINDLINWFNWCLHRSRRYLVDNPATDLELAPVRNKPITFLELEKAKALFDLLEAQYPQYATYYALALFSGIRIDVTHGELTSVVEAVQAGGWPSVLTRKDRILVPRQKVVKTERSRYAWLSEASKAWIAAYPNIEVPSNYAHGKIKKAIGIEQNALRHTSISAYLACGGSISQAAVANGNSEEKIRSNYYVDVDQSVAKQYYLIMPKKGVSDQQLEIAV